MISVKRIKPVLLSCSFFLIFFSLTTTLHAQNTYYISITGSNTNDGLSPQTPKQSIGKMVPGNTYLFKRGDTFYSNVQLVNNVPPDKRIVVGAYGTGAKPIITAYKFIRKNAWTQDSGNIWKVDLKNRANYGGNLDNSNTNVGFIKVNNKIYGNKQNSKDSLKQQWDFYSDAQFLYVYADGNPGVSNTINVTCNNILFTLSDNMDVSNLNLMGSGGHGLRGVDVENVTAKNIDISEIGGSYLYGDDPKKTVRYGNGVELWNSAKNCVISYCRVQDVYDAAFTMQGRATNKYFENVVFKNNYADDNEQSFEFWIMGFKSGFINCKYINNTCLDAGYGWSHGVRPQKDVGVHILMYHWEVNKSDLQISGNTFKNAASGYMYLNLNKDSLFRSYKNKISQKGNGMALRSYFDKYNKKSSSQMKTLTGLEKNSVYKVIK
jgi:hypothetical protein